MALTQFVLKEPIGQLVKTVPLSLSRDGRQELKETFFKALDVKVFVSKEVEGKTIQVKSLENVCEILNKVAKKADELLSNPKVGYPFQPFTPEATKAWKEMIKAVDKVNQGQPKKEQRVFQMLLIHVGFQLFSTDVNGEC